MKRVAVAPGAAVLAMAAMILAPATAKAQQPGRTTAGDTVVHVLEGLVVTAERERSAPPPVATLRVDPEVIERAQAENPYDLVRRVAGLEIHEQGQGPGFASNAVIRGFTSDHSSDVLVVVDGVPLNLPIHGHIEGYADWNGLIAPTISSMRIIHGAASPLYGDFALGGVAEIFTAADAEGTDASVSGSAYGDVGGWLRTGRRGPTGGSLLATEVRRMEGWRDNSDYLLGNALLRGWRWVGSGRLEGGVSGYASRWNSPGFLSVTEYNDGPLTAATDATDGGDVKRLIVNGRYAVQLSTSTYLQATAWGLASDWRLALHIPGHGDGLDLRQTFDSDRRVGTGGQVEGVWLRGENEFTAGVTGRFDRAEYRSGPAVGGELTTADVSVDASHLQGATYVRWRRTFLERLGIDLGGRVDVLHHTARDERVTAAPWIGATQTVVSPKAGVRFQANDVLAFRASSSRGFRSAPGVVGDPDRPPMLAWAHELAAETDLGRFDGSISLFRLDVSNERIVDPVTREISSAGSSVRQGVDVQVRYALSPTIGIHANATYNDARLHGTYADAHDDHDHAHAVVPAFGFDGVIDPPSAGPVLHEGDDVAIQGGQRVPGVARYTGRIGVDARIGGKYDVRGTWRFTGPYTPIGEPSVETRPYSLLDLGATLPLGDRVTIDAELQNVAGIRYAELRASGFINPGPPRSLRAALRFTPRR